MGPAEGERVEALGLKNRAKAEEARVLKREDSDPSYQIGDLGSILRQSLYRLMFLHSV